MISVEAVAWFFMGEGCAELHVAPARSGNRKGKVEYYIMPRARISNNEKGLLDRISNFLIKHKIKHCWEKDFRYHRHYYYTISINGFEPVCRFLCLIYPYLFERKKRIAELILKATKEFKGEDYAQARRRHNVTDEERQRERQRITNIMKYHDEVRLLNGDRRKNQRKYSLKFFEHLWDLRPLEIS